MSPIAGIGVRIPSQNQIVISTGITIYSGNKEIGFILSMSLEGSRRVERARELRAWTAGRVVEQILGPEDLTIRASGYALYQKNILGLLTQGTQPVPPPSIFHSLNLQYIPFDIHVEEVHPVNTAKRVKVIYGNCQITSYTHPIAIRDLYVTETCNIQPAYVLTEYPESEASFDFPSGK